jgi:hypothetical protein
MNVSTRPCFGEEVLERYAMGKCSIADGAPIEEHLLICASCQTQLAAIDEYLRMVRQAFFILAKRRGARQSCPREALLGA